MVAPVIIRDSSEARNRAMLAMSSGWPTANGWPFILSLNLEDTRLAAGPVRVLTRSVITAPGQIALTRMLCSAYSHAIALVKEIIPPLAATYTCAGVNPIRAATDDMLITDPPPLLMSAGIPWREHRKHPSRSNEIV